MKDSVRMLDSQDRRRFLNSAAFASLGVSLFPRLDNAVVAAEKSTPGKAKRIIYLFMAGGMSHIDTFDLKPGHENQGSTKGIATSVTGCQISQHLPVLASQFDKMAVIRSMNTQTGDHELQAHSRPIPSAKYWLAPKQLHCHAPISQKQFRYAGASFHLRLTVPTCQEYAHPAAARPTKSDAARNAPNRTAKGYHFGLSGNRAGYPVAR